ncbi:uncharacterized protein CELE_F20B6.10, partial [Caenorhabditis elegans]
VRSWRRRPTRLLH